MARKTFSSSSFAQGPFPEASFALPVPFTQQTDLPTSSWAVGSELLQQPSSSPPCFPQRSLLLLSSSEQEEASSPPFRSLTASFLRSLCICFSFTNPLHPSLQVSSHPETLIPSPPSFSPVSTATPRHPPSLFSCFLTSSPCHLTFHPAVL